MPYQLCFFVVLDCAESYDFRLRQTLFDRKILLFSVLVSKKCWRLGIKKVCVFFGARCRVLK